MTGRTHDLAAFTALVIAFLALPALPPMSVATAITAFGANFVGGLFPDIDQPTSDFWDNFRLGPFIAKIFCPFVGGHRHIMHSLIGIVLTGLLIQAGLSALSPLILIDMHIVWAAFMIGLISHLVADTFTKEGVPWLWPLRWKIGIPPVKGLRITTGSFVETWLLFPSLLGINAYLLYTHQDRVFTFLKVFVSK